MLRIFGLIMMLAAAALGCRAENPRHVSPKYEMRGVWLVTAYGIDWPRQPGATVQIANRQRRDLDSILVNLHRVGINAVFFQVRPMADALYKSSYEPWSGYLTGKRGSAAPYDPLEHCVEVCHRLGMECHAWINPFRVGSRKPSTPLDLKRRDLWMTNRVNTSIMTIFNPALKETRTHLCNVCREIALNYDIDGIVFDDYFYNPEFIPEDEKAADWEYYLKAAESGKSMAAWRRDNINRAIAEVYAMLNGIKDGKIRFGVSPQGIAGANGAYDGEGVPRLPEYGVITGDSQYNKIYSDPVRWLKDGLVDYISPQIYWTTDNARHPYGALARWWNDVAEMYGRHCFPSQTIAAFAKDNTPARWRESLTQVELNRTSSYNYAPGTVFYSARYIFDKQYGGFRTTLRDSTFAHPALVPPMQWKAKARPLAVEKLSLSADGTLSWRRAGDSRYVVYAIPEGAEDDGEEVFRGDGISPDYIVGVTYTSQFKLPKKYTSGYRIAVTPYDRYGVEWSPAFL